MATSCASSPDTSISCSCAMALFYLDYKPDARTNKPIAQLTIYALALTRLIPGLKLFDIKCAWFNEEEYCEFFHVQFSNRSRSMFVLHNRQCLPQSPRLPW